LLLVVTAIGSVPVFDVSESCLERQGQLEVVLEELLDQVDVGHDHAAAAVALQAKLIHGVTAKLSVSFRNDDSVVSGSAPFRLVRVLNQHNITLPEVAGNLAAREASDRDNHCDGRKYMRLCRR
jgi:hypothetical protein